MKFFEFIPEGVQDCIVTAWLHGTEQFPEMEPYAYKRPAMIICPGGGYEFTSDREAEPVAKRYFAAGFNTFILRYAVKEQARDFYPLCQLASTIAQVRKYADEWYIAEDKIAVIGFSAGGHLACSSGTLFNEKRFLNVFNRDVNIRPNAMVLCYPVITSDEYAHEGSILRVSGAEVGSDQYKWFGLDKHVDSQTPPTFLWHTADDSAVPVENSLKMAAALSSAKIPFEMHIFPEGRHGSSVCTLETASKHTYNANWVEYSILWLNKVLGFER